jgi:hypothetical protein
VNFKLHEELSDADLEAVAGGKGDICGAKVCGADSPCVGNISA